jgi:iron complex transport system ATP-binding protein
MSRLSSQNVSLKYPGHSATIVRDLSVNIADGLITTIIGPNGCGKSTLLRALSRLLRPDAGSVVLDGELIHRLPTKEVARRLGLLHQQTSPPDGITVEDLVRRGRYPHQGFLQPPSRRDLEAVDLALTMTGMQNLRQRPIDELSGGQRQRAWIAMAVAQETDLLLLDEPTTYLDVAHQLEVMELVQRLNEDGKTIVMVLHDINEAVSVSDHIVAMRDGSILVEGVPEAVVKPELLHALYKVRCDVLPHPDDGRPVCNPVSQMAERRHLPATTRRGIEVRGLTTGHIKTRLISRDLFASFPEGKVTCIVGPNACGKSTLLRTGARLLKPQGGSFLIDDRDTRRGSRRSIALSLSVVMQGPTPPAGFLVEDMVAAGRMPHQSPLRQWSRHDEQMVTDALARCDLTELRYRPIDELSGGQRQRAWIAMALAQDTPYLFLDEPTTFLDIGYQIEVLDLVSRLNREDGRTIVMVLHDLNLAARYADHIVAMKDGAILAAGAPSAVLTPELVRQAFGIDAHLLTDERTGAPLVLARETTVLPELALAAQ